MEALVGSSHIWPHVFTSVEEVIAAQPLTAQPHGARQKCPLDQSLQEMLGLPFLSHFSSEDSVAGHCQKRQLFFPRAFFSAGQVGQEGPQGFK